MSWRRLFTLASVGWLLWLTYPLVTAALALLFLVSQSPANPLFRVRFLLSRPALNAAASGALARDGQPAPRSVGLFRVRRIDAYPPQEVRYLAGGCGVVDECGLIFIAGLPPAARAKMRLKPLGGAWYHRDSVS